MNFSVEILKNWPFSPNKYDLTGSFLDPDPWGEIPDVGSGINIRIPTTSPLPHVIDPDA
jgi:hypothetical protein